MTYQRYTNSKQVTTLASAFLALQQTPEKLHHMIIDLAKKKIYVVEL